MVVLISRSLGTGSSRQLRKSGGVNGIRDFDLRASGNDCLA